MCWIKGGHTFHAAEGLLPPAGFESTPFRNFPLQAAGLQAHATTPGKNLSPVEYFTVPIKSSQVTIGYGITGPNSRFPVLFVNVFKQIISVEKKTLLKNPHESIFVT